MSDYGFGGSLSIWAVIRFASVGTAGALDMTNSQIEYEWPNKYATADKKQLEALGVISLNFNLYEHSLVIFFEEKFYKDVAGFLFHKLSNEERAALIVTGMRPPPRGREIHLRYILA